MQLRGTFLRLRQQQDGVAYIEFALILPVLMLLLLGGIELSRYIQAGQKVDKMTHTIVDLVAQAPTISLPELNQIMLAAQHVMQPYDFTQNGTIIVSCVGYDRHGNLRVKWQHRGGGNLSRTSKIGHQGQTPHLPSGFTLDSRDNIIIAESFFLISPLVNEKIVEPSEFYRTAYYLPRLGELDTLQSH